jgi:hypothetical protein
MLEFSNVLLASGQLVKEFSLDPDWNEEEALISRTSIFELIEECFGIFETATQEIYDRCSFFGSHNLLIGEIGSLQGRKEP